MATNRRYWSEASEVPHSRASAAEVNVPLSSHPFASALLPTTPSATAPWDCVPAIPTAVPQVSTSHMRTGVLRRLQQQQQQERPRQQQATPWSGSHGAWVPSASPVLHEDTSSTSSLSSPRERASSDMYSYSYSHDDESETTDSCRSTTTTSAASHEQRRRRRVGHTGLLRDDLVAATHIHSSTVATSGLTHVRADEDTGDVRGVMAITPPPSTPLCVSPVQHALDSAPAAAATTRTSEVAAIQGVPVRRAAGIQVLEFRGARPERTAAASETGGTTVASGEDAHDRCCHNLPQKNPAPSQELKRTEEDVLKAVSLPGRVSDGGTHDLPRRPAAVLGQLPSTSMNNFPHRAQRTPSLLRSPPPPLLAGGYSAAKPFNSSPSFGPEPHASPFLSTDSSSEVLSVRAGVEDPLSYKPPRVRLHYQNAHRTAPSASTPASSSQENTGSCVCSDSCSCLSRSTRTDDVCTCCSACGGLHGDDCSCARHTQNSSAVTTLAEFACVSHEAHRKKHCKDPFATLGPAAPPLLRLGAPRQTCRLGALAAPPAPGADGAEPIHAPPPLAFSRNPDENSDASPQPARAEDRVDAGTQTDGWSSTHAEAQEGAGYVVSVGTQVENECLAETKAGNDGGAMPPCRDVEAFQALLAAQTTSLQAEWHAWAAQMTAAHDVAQRPATCDAASSPHETELETALWCVRWAACDGSAQEVHAALAELYMETREAQEEATYQRTQLVAAEERERQGAEALAAATQSIQNLLTEQLVSVEVAEAQQRLLLLDMEAHTRQSVLVPAFASLRAVQADHCRQLQAWQQRWMQQRVVEMCARQVDKEVMEAEASTRQRLMMEEQAIRFTTLTPAFYAERQSLAVQASTATVAALTSQIATLEEEKTALEQTYTALYQQDQERRIALAAALRQPTVTLSASSLGRVLVNGPDHFRNDKAGEEEEDLPIHRRFARAHQEALKAVRAQARRV